MKIDRVHQMLCAAVCLILVTFAGCFGGNSKVGYVEGTITIDGEPMEYVRVAFYPVSGRPSTGQTDASGHYVLNYVKGQKGALIGNHKVTVSSRIDRNTFTYGDYAPGEAPLLVAGRGEVVPDDYVDKKKTELAAEVKRGNNTFDFAIETK